MSTRLSAVRCQERLRSIDFLQNGLRVPRIDVETLDLSAFADSKPAKLCQANQICSDYSFNQELASGRLSCGLTIRNPC